MSQPVIHFDYDFSPYGQKTKLLLTAAGVDYKKCDQPRVLPRPDLEALGITYRRIPLLAIGKDVYADSSLIIQQVMTKLAKGGSVPTSPADKPFEEFGNAAFKEVVSGLIPAQALTPEFVKDRATIFPAVKRPDIASLRPSALAMLQSRCTQVEETFLSESNAGKAYMNGSKPSLADIHYLWSLRWAMNDLGAGQEKGCGKDDFPKLWRAIESLPPAKPEVLGSAETLKTITESDYVDKDLSVSKDDPLGLEEGTVVSVENADTVPGAHPQIGKLIGTSVDEIVLEVGNDGVHLHFPRIGYFVRPQQQ